jgi:hypothetical protein|tara:strand:+ start:584 stop:1411 length:828 start_codon:yes stop_codon:yes gene_type:complete
MAIQDKSISEANERLAREYGSDILNLNSADLSFITQFGYVTGSDILNVDKEGNAVFRAYRVSVFGNANPFEFKVNDYLGIVTKLGILGYSTEVSLTKRKARSLKGATGKGAAEKEIQYKELFKGRALFTAPADLKGTETSLSGSALFIEYDNLPTEVKTELDSKMIETSFIEKIMRPSGSAAELGDLTYIQIKEGRELAARSMQAQGLKINRKNLKNKSNAPGTRGRFNSFNNHGEHHYATGSWKTTGGGPRIQGPAGGGNSCKFVIIHRSGSLG